MSFPHNPCTLPESPPPSPTSTHSPSPLPTHDDWKGSPFTSSDSTLQSPIRFLFQNIHGLSSQHISVAEGIHDFNAQLDHYDIHLAGISEHNLSAQSPSTHTIISEAVKRAAPRSQLHAHLNSSESQTTSPTLKSTSNHRLIGGTGLFLKPPLIGRMAPKSHGGDPLGRWSYCTLRRDYKPPLTIISIYQVCKKPTNHLGHTAWHQQRIALDILNRHEEHPRDAFLSDLSCFITTLQHQEHDLIIGGDWNDFLDSPRSSVLKLCTEHQLSDPWLHLHPDHPN